MPVVPAITELEQLKGHPAVARLLAWNPAAVTGVKFDRDEMTIWVDRGHSGKLARFCATTRSALLIFFRM